MKNIFKLSLLCILCIAVHITQVNCDSDMDSIIIIPIEQNNDKPFQQVNSFRIDGKTLIEQVVQKISIDDFLKAISDLPEWALIFEGLDAITIGDVYRKSFPNGFVTAVREKILKRNLKSKNLFDNFTHHKIPAMMATVINQNRVEAAEAAVVEEAAADAYFDPITDEEKDSFENETLKESPITDDYVYDQPIEDRPTEIPSALISVERSSKSIILSSDNNSTDSIDESATKKSDYPNQNYINLGLEFRKWISKFMS